MLIGFCGAHRTGKTTLARGLAETLGLPLLDIGTRAVFAEMGLSPSAALSPAERLAVQGQILVRATAVYQSAAETGGVCDRTPLDMMAYFLADMGPGVAENAGIVAAVQQYVAHCLALTNEFFSDIVVVQPGIAYAADAAAGNPDPVYVDHLAALMLGIAIDERVAAHVHVLPKSCTGLEARHAWLQQNLCQTAPELYAGALILHRN